MKTFQLTFTLLLLALLVGCQPAPADKQPEATTAPTTTLVTSETVLVDVDSTGLMRFGGKEYKTLEDFQAALVDSLRVLKKQGRAMPNLGYNAHGDVLMGMRGALKDVFLAAQEAVK